jgi:hypothetical protein
MVKQKSVKFDAWKLWRRCDRFFKKNYGAKCRIETDGVNRPIIFVRVGKKKKRFADLLNWTQLFGEINQFCKSSYHANNK